MTHPNSQWLWLPAHDQDSQNFKWLRENLTKIHPYLRTYWQMMIDWGTDSRFPSETVIFLCPRNSPTPTPTLTALSGVSWLKIVLYFLDDYMF